MRVLIPIEPVSHPNTGRQPVHSPDGRWLSFRSTRGGTSEGSVPLRHASDHRLQNGLSQDAGPISNFLCLIYDRPCCCTSGCGSRSSRA